MKPIIRVENLSKQYRIGAQKSSYGTLRDTLTNAITAPIRRFQNPKPETQNPKSETLWALKDINFEVMPGEVIGIIGHNGAGKSTLLKILSRITEPTSGRINLHGRIGSLLEVGTGFHPELTGRENIFLNGAILGMKRAEITKCFDEIVGFAEVEQFLDTPVKHYSSGMYMRLAFAVAAYLNPEVLVVDEVLAVGDAGFQKKCLKKMGAVANEGRTVLLVSHNLPAIEGLCTNAIVIEKGQLVYKGTPDSAIKNFFRYTKTPTKIPLADREDRIGEGQSKIVSIKIFDKNNLETDHIEMGENFSVELRIKGALKKAIVGILFGDEYTQQLVRGYTWEQVAGEIELTGDDVIRCQFEKFPMMHGSYNIHTWLGQSNNSLSTICMDLVEQATIITIIPKDVFRTGRVVDRSGGKAFCQATWQLNGSNLF